MEYVVVKAQTESLIVYDIFISCFFSPHRQKLKDKTKYRIGSLYKGSLLYIAVPVICPRSVAILSCQVATATIGDGVSFFLVLLYSHTLHPYCRFSL